MRQGLDVDAFAELVRRTREPLYAYAVAIMWEPTVAEDVVQRAFELAFAKRHTFRPELGSASAWMFGITRHVALDERRRMSRGPRVASRGEIPERCDFDLNLERTDRRSFVAALQTLDEADRELIALKFWDDLPNGEIAAMLRCSESNVGTRLHRAIGKLREVFHDGA